MLTFFKSEWTKRSEALGFYEIKDMDNLVFYALLAVLLWYFFYYLPRKKQTFRPAPKPNLTSKSTQTETVYEYEPGPELLSDKTPGSYPFSKEEQQELESTLDFLIKEMQDLDKSL